ncbi:helix-turn-helix transcriptional regulator [Mesorhizobium neociceri]|uniref:Helix-turn-helix transcriptional regulator n=1 Tax=Mesorhizobium neociceri TaxID=1307853 RepID=A0A838B7T3_9HYPH|nr:AraC family transcriptional regulator [Mesorhizobium neociceri]MBA1141999.1 helix-turn-helix transcriptional regulator [Mesorhizobium neociceri]
MQHRGNVLENAGTERRRADRRIFDGIPESAGRRLVTFRGGAAHAVCAPGSCTFKAGEHLGSVMLKPSPGITASLGSGKIHEYDGDVGTIMIIPANIASKVAWSSATESAIVALAPESLTELAEREFGTGRAELQPPPFGTVDPQALQLAQLLRAELTRREAPNEFYVDSLVTMFGVHMLRNYAGAGKLPQGPKGGLSNRSAARVREFLGVNFSSRITVAELAAVSGLSPNHFILAFTKTFGEPPHKYLLRLRLDFAEKLLVESDLSIAEVAHLSGFSDQSHLTVTMSKYRGRTPKQVKLRR